MNIQELSQRKRALENVQNIVDLPQYAEAWNVLGADFQALGITANAESCWRRFRHYREQDLEGYARLLTVHRTASRVTAVTEEVA
jgi:hypothetical protein